MRDEGQKIITVILTGAVLAAYLPDTDVCGKIGEVRAAEVSETLAYLDTSLSFEERAADLVSRMTSEEKAQQLITSSAAAIPRLGVSEYNYWSEGLHGVARLYDRKGGSNTENSDSYRKSYI